jgi:hypothetical protein
LQLAAWTQVQAEQLEPKCPVTQASQLAPVQLVSQAAAHCPLPDAPSLQLDA